MNSGQTLDGEDVVPAAAPARRVNLSHPARRRSPRRDCHTEIPKLYTCSYLGTQSCHRSSGAALERLHLLAGLEGERLPNGLGDYDLERERDGYNRDRSLRSRIAVSRFIRRS